MESLVSAGRALTLPLSPADMVVDHVRRRELERAYLEVTAGLPESEAPSPKTQLLLLEALAR